MADERARRKRDAIRRFRRGAHADTRRILLPDGAKVVVVGGGPAGAFFAIRALRKARRLARRLDLLILERKQELRFYQAAPCEAFREGCNYCAGGISPRLAALLRENELTLPPGTVAGKAKSLTVHGDWKSIELPVPETKDMLFVFRGSRPKDRPSRHESFDSYLLGKAAEEGARVVTGEVRDLRYSPHTKPVVGYRLGAGTETRDVTVEADFVVLGAGVNETPGMHLESNRLFQAAVKAIPGFRPPRVRKALIGEIQAEEGALRYMGGEVHFALYGSKSLRIEMSSLIPKGRWITVALLGQSVDEADPSEYPRIIERFLQLPHIQRFLPQRVQFASVCLCHPNMTVGVARNPCGHRMAVVGDMVISRLYKDGILSAYTTAAALADCVLDLGVDRHSLEKGYATVIRRLHLDNRFGEVVFLLNRLTFSQPVLSRIIYQAVLTERKTRPARRRRLANVLWRIASGDDSYGHILLSMLHPATIWLIFVGGLLVTARNSLTERLFALKWTGFARYPTGLPKEAVVKKRLELKDELGAESSSRPPQFERMYSIRVTAEATEIFRALGRFGDSDRRYFRPRWVNVQRTAGNPNELGSVVEYKLPLQRLSFSIILEKVTEPSYLLYRVRDGFARGGILVFDITTSAEEPCVLSIYAAFNFPKSRSVLKRLAWTLFRMVFPAFSHDVLWNCALCELKHVVETENRPPPHPDRRQG